MLRETNENMPNTESHLILTLENKNFSETQNNHSNKAIDNFKLQAKPQTNKNITNNITRLGKQALHSNHAKNEIAMKSQGNEYETFDGHNHTGIKIATLKGSFVESDYAANKTAKNALSKIYIIGAHFFYFVVYLYFYISCILFQILFFKSLTNLIL